MKRTDVHRPAEFNPADYQVKGYIDNKRPVPPRGADAAAYAAYERYVAWWEGQIQAFFPNWTTGGGDHCSIFQCNHCGHPGIRWVAVVEYLPTGENLAFGEICAERCELPGRSEFAAKYIKTQAQLQEAAYEKACKLAQFEADYPDVVEYLYNDANNSDFIHSLCMQLRSNAELSERQVEVVRRNITRDAERQAKRDAEPKPTSPLLVGRRTITGTILSTKWQESDYGGALKMLVREADANKVWGTVPTSLTQLTWRRDHHDADGMWVSVDPVIEELKGQMVTFTATVERSRDDEHFGFFKRPTGAKLAEQLVLV